MSTTVTDSIAISSDLGQATAWYPEATSSVTTAAPAPSPRRRDPRVIAAISDLIHSYHRPAYMADERGEVIAMNAAAGRLLDEDNTDKTELNTSATVQIGDRTFKLFVPPPEEIENEEPLTETHLPPRLARIARLVVSGCTDKQIAARTGLSFSTVRTYVRQIYRRVGVHNRVELVHRTNAGGVLL
jgi:DNA-binding NarL/FixJ family response regulator